MTTPDQINARIDAAIKESTEKYEALRVDMLKEVKPAYEVGEHYIAKCNGTNAKYLIKLDSITKGGFFAKYFIVNDVFSTDGLFDSIERKATPSEVLQALKNEAVKLGLIPGAKVKRDFMGDTIVLNDGLYYEYELEEDGLYCHGNYIMRDGKWAEVVTPVKEKAMEGYIIDWYTDGLINLNQCNDLIYRAKKDNLKITTND